MILDLPATTEQLLLDNAKQKGLGVQDYLLFLLKNDKSPVSNVENTVNTRFPVGLMANKNIIIRDDFDEPLDDLFNCLH